VLLALEIAMNHPISVFLAGATGASDTPASGSVAQLLQLVTTASPIVRTIFFILVAFILLCIFITIYKFIQIQRAQRQTRRFLNVFWSAKRLEVIYQAAEAQHRSPVSQLFKAGYIELSRLKGPRDHKENTAAATDEETSAGGIGNVERALRRAATTEITHLESMVPILATNGATAPFIGLLGTVIGIMISFFDISASGSTGLDVVAKGISEALLVTAVGLVSAIPAVISYNYFQRRIHVLSAEMDNFSADFLNIVKRHFLK
jgi:biopolymer transport protein TolQ